jgi:hypothetical protein
VDYSNEVKIQKQNRYIDSLLKLNEYDKVINELEMYSDSKNSFYYNIAIEKLDSLRHLRKD